MPPGRPDRGPDEGGRQPEARGQAEGNAELEEHDPAVEPGRLREPAPRGGTSPGRGPVRQASEEVRVEQMRGEERQADQRGRRSDRQPRRQDGPARFVRPVAPGAGARGSQPSGGA